jgi:hypothetical protein
MGTPPAVNPTIVVTIFSRAQRTGTAAFPRFSATLRKIRDFRCG